MFLFLDIAKFLRRHIKDIKIIDTRLTLKMNLSQSNGVLNDISIIGNVIDFYNKSSKYVFGCFVT